MKPQHSFRRSSKPRGTDGAASQPRGRSFKDRTGGQERDVRESGRREQGKRGSDRGDRPYAQKPRESYDTFSPKAAPKSFRPFEKRRDKDKRDRGPEEFGSRDFRKKDSEKTGFGKSEFLKRRFGKTDRPFEAKKKSYDAPRHDKPRHDKPRRDSAPADVARYARPTEERRPARPFSPANRKPSRPPVEMEREKRLEGTVLWGVHAVREAWLNPRRVCLGLWMTEANHAAAREMLELAKEKGLKRPEPKIVKREELDRLLPPGSVHQGVILTVEPLPDVELSSLWQGETPPSLIVVLDHVTDPHNVGAILRSAAAFGAGGVVMTERNAPGTTGVMAKTASGAVEHIPLVHVVNLARALTELKAAGYWCVGLAEEGERALSALDLTGRTALVLGAEGEGLRRLTREHCDELARLPTTSVLGSLNVSNAAAVALYEVRRQVA